MCATQVYWNALCRTYWVHWHMLEIVAGTNGPDAKDAADKASSLTRTIRLAAGSFVIDARTPLSLLFFSSPVLRPFGQPEHLSSVSPSCPSFCCGLSLLRRSQPERLPQASGRPLLAALLARASAGGRGRRSGGADSRRVVGAPLLCQEAGSRRAAGDDPPFDAQPRPAGAHARARVGAPPPHVWLTAI